jgi:hypothetical protein
LPALHIFSASIRRWTSETSKRASSIFMLMVLFVRWHAVVFVTQAERRIPMQTPKRSHRFNGGTGSFKLNASGVIAIIFAQSLICCRAVERPAGHLHPSSPSLARGVPHVTWKSPDYFLLVLHGGAFRPQGARGEFQTVRDVHWGSVRATTRAIGSGDEPDHAGGSVFIAIIDRAAVDQTHAGGRNFEPAGRDC